MAEETEETEKAAEVKSLIVELFREDVVLIDLLRRENESTLNVIRRALYDNFEFQMLKRTVNYLEKKVEDIAGRKQNVEEEEFEEILERQKNIEKIRDEVRKGKSKKNLETPEDAPDFKGSKERMKQAMERNWAIKSQIRKPE